MSDDPFAEPGDDDRTIIRRPQPGGAARRVAGGVQAGRNATRSAPEPSVGSEDVGLGAPPLLAAASALLSLLGRIRGSATPPGAGDLRGRTEAELRAFERACRDAGIDREPAHDALLVLCAALDDAALATPWGQAGAWRERPLLAAFGFGEDRFYDLMRALRARPDTNRDLLELQYFCLSCGYLGRYRDSPRGAATVERIRADLHGLLAPGAGAGPAPPLSPRVAGVAAPYRAVRAAVPVWIAAVLGVAISAFAVLFVSWRIDARADAFYGAAIAAPPSRMPAISRAAPSPPPPPPPASVPTEADALRAALGADIGAGRIAVGGTVARPTLTIEDDILFGSAAGLRPAGAALLRRVGQALAPLGRNVEVEGYSDDRPLRSVAFGSGFALSAARARAAGAILAQALPRTGHVTSAGRGQADPIASNATAGGRARNRRITILLAPQAE